MVTRTLLLILLSSAGIVWQGCTGAEDSGPAKDDHSLLPLAVGNQWIYEVSATDSSGNVVKAWNDTMTVVGQREINGEQWFLTLGFLIQDTIPLASRPDGLWMMSRENTPVHFFKDSVEIGNTYRRSGVFTVRVAGLGANVKVPAGSYSCNVYDERFENSTSSVSYYVSRGTGLVLMSTESVILEHSEGTVEKKLIAVTLN